MNLGEEIVEKYKNDWFIVDTTMMVGTGNGIVEDTHYVQFENYWEHWFEIADLNWNMTQLTFNRIDQIGKFSKLNIVKEPELIEKLNKAKRRGITKKSIKLGEPLETKKTKRSKFEVIGI